jgi:hypothetical protein
MSLECVAWYLACGQIPGYGLDPAAPTTSAMASANVVILHDGFPPGIGHVALKAVPNLVLEGCPHVMVHVLHSFSFVDGDQQVALANACTTILPVKGTVAHISALFAVCQTGMQRWTDNAAKVLFVVNEAGLEWSHGPQMSVAVAAPTSPSCAEVSCVSVIEAGVSLLQSSLGDGHVGTLWVGHTNDNSNVRTTLSGSDVALGCFDYDYYSPFIQSWHYVAWPVIDPVVGHSSAAPAAVEHDGWRWCGHAVKPACFVILTSLRSF